MKKKMVKQERNSAPIHEGHRARVRERFHKEGLDAFADHEVLEFALFYAFPRADTNVLAHRLLDRFGSLAGVLEATPADLSSVVGIGDAAAVFLNFIPQLARRYLMDRVTTEKTFLKTSEDAMRYAISLMAGRAEEVFFVVSLDAVCRVVHAVLLAQGTVSEVRLHPRQVVEVALRNRASSVLFIHNHPAGTAKPSTDDLRLTETLVNAFKPLSIKVVDHIIVAGDQAYSSARENVMPK